MTTPCLRGRGPRKWLQLLGTWTRPTATLERLRRYGPRVTVRLPFQPPFVMLSDPADVKELFAAPPEVLHPGEGAWVLEPIIGPLALHPRLQSLTLHIILQAVFGLERGPRLDAPLPGSELRPAGDEDRAAGGARSLRAERCRADGRDHAPTGNHLQPARRCHRGAGRAHGHAAAGGGPCRVCLRSAHRG
jgi:hypothetical protein